MRILVLGVEKQGSKMVRDLIESDYVFRSCCQRHKRKRRDARRENRMKPPTC